MHFSKPSKAIEATQEMLAQIERVTGTAVAATDIVIFEAAAMNTRPLTKMGSIFHNARASEETLNEMANALNSGAESVPLHTLHAQGYELPIGKVFQGEVIRLPDGEAELRAMFYLPRSEAQMIEKINIGIIDEVSVGVKSKALLCSKCGFDYFEGEAGYEHLFSQTCANGHTVGVDGTHVKLSGLDKWMELSLVSRGAASKPKILGRTKQVMAKETYDRIAADGLPPEAVVLFTASDESNKEVPMDPELKAALEALTSGLADVKAALTPATPPQTDPEPNAELDALRVELAAANARIAEFEAAEAAEAEAAAAAEAEAAAQAAAAQAAAEAEAANLHSSLPVGGVAASIITDAGKPATPVFAAFKTPKR